MKICTVCEVGFDEDNFPSNGKGRTRSACKQCWAARARRWREINREKKAAQNKRYWDPKHVSASALAKRRERVEYRRKLLSKERTRVYREYKDELTHLMPEDALYHKRVGLVYKMKRDEFREKHGYTTLEGMLPALDLEALPWKPTIPHKKEGLK